SLIRPSSHSSGRPRLQKTAGQETSIAPGHRCAASDTDITSNVQGATVAKPKKPNSKQAHVPSHTSAPMSFRPRRITTHQLSFYQDRRDGLISCSPDCAAWRIEHQTTTLEAGDSHHWK